MRSEPKFKFGDTVWVPKIQETKKVLGHYDYKGGDWAYMLTEPDGTVDESWLEHELEKI